MAERKVWLGSIGPFLYDDEDILVDDDEVIDTQKGLYTDGEIYGKGDSIKLEYTPTNYETDDEKLGSHLEGIDDKIGDFSEDVSDLDNRLSNVEQTVSDHETRLGNIEQQLSGGWSGTFQTGDNKTVIVQNGLIIGVS